MNDPRGSPYHTRDLTSTETYTGRSIPKKKAILSISDGVNYILNKIPFPPSFKSFNGVKIIFIITFLHRIHFYSVYAFIANLSATRLKDNDVDDVNEDSPEIAHAYFAFVFMLGMVIPFLGAVQRLRNVGVTNM